MADSHTKTCTHDGCGRPVRARMLCVTHYNQRLPNRHGKVTRSCDGCGAQCTKDARADRYAGVYCSLLCRDYARWGALSSDLPTDHWARLYGATCDWAAPEPKPRAFQCGECGECGAGIVEPTGQTPSRWCSARCAHRVAKRRRRALEYNAPGEFRFSEVMRIYLRQGKVCAYCEQRVAGLPDPEHVLPLSRGGRNDVTNLVAACRPCNADKGDLTLAEWAVDRQRRGLPQVRTVLPRDTYSHLVETQPTAPAWRDRQAA